MSNAAPRPRLKRSRASLFRGIATAVGVLPRPGAARAPFLLSLVLDELGAASALTCAPARLPKAAAMPCQAAMEEVCLDMDTAAHLAFGCCPPASIVFARDDGELPLSKAFKSTMMAPKSPESSRTSF